MKKLIVLMFVVAVVCYSQTRINGGILVEGGISFLGESDAVTDAYIANSTGNLPQALNNGACYTFIADVANTGAATLDVDDGGALAAKSIVQADGTALENNDIVAGQHVRVCYDSGGDHFQYREPGAGGAASTWTFWMNAAGYYRGSIDASVGSTFAVGNPIATEAPWYGATHIFNDGADQGAGFQFRLRDSFTSVKFTFVFDASASGLYDTFTRTACVASGEAWPPAYPASWNTLGATERANISPGSAGVVDYVVTPDVTNCAAGEMLAFLVSRDDDGVDDDDADSASDTGGDLELIGVLVEVTL